MLHYCLSTIYTHHLYHFLKRELRIAVRDFSNWLCDKVKVIKDEIDRFETKANIMIVLLGHSMGGIVCK
jgi:alpha-beta hydrolase superfamily lysophospholipase